MRKKKIAIILALILAVAGFIGRYIFNIDKTVTHTRDSLIVDMALSSNGRYLVTASNDHHILLWNLKHHRYKKISNQGNRFSPYFIQGKPIFLWQQQDLRPWHYIAIQGQPSKRQIVSIETQHTILLSKQSDQYYLFFSNHNGEYKHYQLPHSLVAKNLENYLPIQKAIDGYQLGYAAITDSQAQFLMYQMALQLGLKADNTVYVQTISGNTLEKFNNFPVYNEVMTRDLHHYFFSTANWSLYTGKGKQVKLIMLDNDGYFLWRRLLALQLSYNDQWLLTSSVNNQARPSPLFSGRHQLINNLTFHQGYYHSSLEGLVLWNVQKSLPVKKFSGLDQKIASSISPDDQTIVAGDDNGHLLSWPLSGERLTRYQAPPGEGVAIRFIDADHFLFFQNGSDVVYLYRLGVKHYLKVLSLGSDPYVVDGSDASEAIVTAPKAHVLVMAQARRHGGIVVFHYDASNKDLVRMWVAS